MKVAEIYRSCQGEGRLSGTPSVFVRTSGCNLRCWFCDTPFASWTPEGADLSVDEVVSQVAEWDCPHVVITGGEPMLWSELMPAGGRAACAASSHHDRNGRHAVFARPLRSDVDQSQAVEFHPQRGTGGPLAPPARADAARAGGHAAADAGIRLSA